MNTPDDITPMPNANNNLATAIRKAYETVAVVDELLLQCASQFDPTRIEYIGHTIWAGVGRLRELILLLPDCEDRTALLERIALTSNAALWWVAQAEAKTRS